MDKLVAIRIKYDDGTYSNNIPLSVLAVNIDWDGTHNLVDVLGNVDLNKGSIQEQINALTITITPDNVQYDLTHTLSDVLGDVDLDKGDLQTQIDNISDGEIQVDSTLTTAGKAADAKAVGDNLKNVVRVGNSNVTNFTSIILGDTEEQVNLLDQSDLIGINTRLSALESGDIQTDQTLSIQGMAADAKATGDAIHNLQGLVGTPLVAATAASMTNTDKIYVYTGSETGYTNGNWYYHDGTSWVSGGVYNSVAVDLDSTLTISGKASDSKSVGDAIRGLKSAISGITSCSLLPITREKYYMDTSGRTVNLSQFIYNPIFNCYMIPCVEGDVFTINALGGSAPQAWAFAQSDGIILDRTKTTDVSDYVAVAPKDAAWLIINDKGGRVSFSGRTSTAKFAELDNHDALQDANINANTEDIEKLYTNSENYAKAIIDIATPTTTEITTTRIDSTFINTQGVIASAPASFYILSANVTVGEKYVVNGYAVQNGYLYIFVDANGNTVQKSTEKGGRGGTDYYEIIATAPDTAVKLIVSGNIGTAHPPIYIGVLTGYAVTDIKTIPTAEVGIVPAPGFPHYPMIDSVNKKIRIMNSTIIIDRRTSNKKYYDCPETVVDFSNLTTSAIAVYFDVANSEFIATAYSDTQSAESYLLFMLIRTNEVSANHITVSAAFPVMIDGMLDGVVYSKNQNVRSVNHRGLEQIAPENTLIAFQYSKMAGFDCVETDIRFTEDGVPVLLHDATINRTARNADGTTLAEDLAIADITYEEALIYDFGIWKNAKFAGQKIPTFEQFIRACRNLGLHPYIELKVGTEEQIRALNTVVIRNGMQGKVSWISYGIDYLEYIHTVDARARLGIVTSDINFSKAFSNRLLALKGNNEVFVDVDNVNAVTNAGVEGLIALGLPLELYTGTIANIVNADPYITGFTLGAFNAGKELIAHYSVN